MHYLLIGEMINLIFNKYKINSTRQLETNNPTIN